MESSNNDDVIEVRPVLFEKDNFRPVVDVAAMNGPPDGRRLFGAYRAATSLEC